ncbi:MAG: glycosyltransferase [Verrucomicrobia bacterium]|nr:glycosyltransferase [Verrucomicrobiota bacterium]
MKISVVVPAYNEEKLIAASLRSIQAALPAFTRLGWETEIIVCDNNSSDRTADLARTGGARVVSEPVNQISRARNTGAAAAEGDWLIFIDADSYPSVELFGDIAAKIQTGGCIGGGATVRLDEAEFWGRVLMRFWNGISRARRWMAGSCIFCEAAAFRQLGGFSVELFASEEIDFSQRLKRLARQTHRRVIILDRHSLVTSARKMRLYSRGEYIRFLAHTVLTGGRTLRKRSACVPWYDGRR